MNIKTELKNLKKASLNNSNLSTEKKNEILENIIFYLDNRREELLAANTIDLDLLGEVDNSKSLIKKISFDEYKINEAIKGIKSLIELPDPVDKTIFSRQLDEGLDLYRVTCPIGVIAFVFEGRPEDLIRISAMALKSGNTCVIKGRKESKNTVRILFEMMKEASEKAGILSQWLVNLEEDYDIAALLKMDDCIDLIIPQGSNDFVSNVVDNTKIPVLGRSKGVCHIYIDEEFDEKMAIDIVIDSKTQYVSVDNSLETLLVNKNVSSEFIEKLFLELDRKRLVINASPEIRKIIEADELTEEKLRTEFSDYEMNIKMVESLDDAIEHINNYGSGHTDVIISKNGSNALKFMDYVDSANVFYNCSTRFSDGLSYGFGAEVCHSTVKLHARGPVGLEGLVIYKYKLIGHGQTVEEYAKGEKNFSHKDLHRNFE